MQKECLVFKQNQDPRIATCDTCGVSLDNHSFRKIYPTSLKYNPADVSKSASDQETVAAGAEVRAGEFEIICKSCKKLNNGCSPKDDYTECPIPENYEAL